MCILPGACGTGGSNTSGTLHPEFQFNSHVTGVVKDSPYWPSWVERAKTDGDAALKVHRYQQRPGEELYDLQADPQETHNLAGDERYAEQIEAMRGMLTEWMNEQGRPAEGVRDA